jgi:sialate O-acetylesterase
LATSASAEVRLANIISDNMVLQKGAKVAIWGYATPGEKITVEFAGQKKSTVADATNIPPEPSDGSFLIDGRRKRHLLRDTYPRSRDGQPMAHWLIYLYPMKASAESRVLKVFGSETIEVKNVLVGEVWFAAGQSNMAWGIKQRIKNRERAIELSKNSLIRMTKPGYGGCQEKRFGTPFTWDVISPKTINNHSANPFYFAQKLKGELNVPVGIIMAATGGALIESFTDLPTLRKDPDYPIKYDAHRKSWNEKPSIRRFPTSMFYAMVEPCMPFTIKGAIWYQGENSIGDDYYYRDKLAAMISSWRKSWDCGEFSFYVAQLAGGPPAKSPEEDKHGYQPGFGWPDFRESQSAIVDLVPNTDVANLIDIGESNNVHGYNKEAQGGRLALLALAHDYDKDTACSGPRYKSHKLVGTKFIVTFDHVGKGLTAAKMEAVLCDPPYKGRKGVASKEWAVSIDKNSNEELSGFAILAFDKSIEKPDIHWAWPKVGVNKIVTPRVKIISRDTIEAWSDKITDPKQIIGLRYNWARHLTGNLYNLDGHPAFPFRTDKLKTAKHRQIDIQRAKTKK